MGYAINGYCFADSGVALASFIQQNGSLPQLTGYWVNGVINPVETGLFLQFEAQLIKIDDGTTVVRQFNVQPCSTPGESVIPKSATQSFIEQALTIPSADELSTAFTIPFVLILVSYLVSWAFGLLIRFAQAEEH